MYSSVRRCLKNNHFSGFKLEFNDKMGDESDSESFLRSKRKRKVRYVIEDDDEASASDSSMEITCHTKRIKASKKNCIRDSESDSDSSIEVLRRKKRIGVSKLYSFFVLLQLACVIHLFHLLVTLFVTTFQFVFAINCLLIKQL